MDHQVQEETTIRPLVVEEEEEKKGDGPLDSQ